MPRKPLHHFRFDEHTIALMDVLIKHPPRNLAEGPNGPVASRTDLIRRLVWEASRDVPPTLLAAASKTEAEKVPSAAKRQTKSKR